MSASWPLPSSGYQVNPVPGTLNLTEGLQLLLPSTNIIGESDLSF
jgi:hypothetical protein